MNNLYLFCEPCKVFVDAGYRWAYSTLVETEVVVPNDPINIARLLGADEYWNPGVDEQSKWLVNDVLPAVRHFLTSHGNHRVVFGEDSLYFDSNPDWFLEWLQEGFLACLLPRFLKERLKLDSWADVCRYVEGLKSAPAWWNDPEERQRTERWFRCREE